MNTSRLILFDIDGTLILTGGAGRRALNRAFEETFGIGQAFEAVPMAGRTDPLIIADACLRCRVDGSAARLAELHERYLVCLADELPRGGADQRVLPGVVELLEALQIQNGVAMGLLTGNVSRAARLKLEHFGLWQYFPSGAFGEDAEGRDGLVPVAAARMAARGCVVASFSRVVVIGDTPHDVACARAHGARSLAVATGFAAPGELTKAGADAVLPNLARTTDVVRLLEALADDARPLQS